MPHLLEQAREHLEERVQERTRELSVARDAQVLYLSVLDYPAGSSGPNLARGR